MYRYEIERALLEGTLAVDDLPKVWNQKMQEYLGFTPETDATGVLQDVVSSTEPWWYILYPVMSGRLFRGLHHKMSVNLCN